MKGLNVKRIAAIGLGAALVGSALAPAVMAGVYSNLTDANTGLKKANIVDATGTPVVDIIVGSLGQAPDVVWAGNIAAKVAQLATVDVAGSGTKTVDITVGGTATTSGAGDTVESAVSFSAAEANFGGIQVTDSKMPSLVNETSATLTWAGVDYTTTVKEVLKGTADVDFQGDTSSTKYASGELFASVNAGDLNYTVELGAPGIPLVANAYKNLDGNSDYDVKLPFLGKVYKLDEVKADSLIMYADTTPTDLKVGEKITVTPGTAYAGKKMEIQLVDLIQVGSGNTTYEPKWALLIDGVASKYVQKGATTTYDLRTEFGKSYFNDSVYVTNAGLNLAANTYTATIRTGSDRIELKDGKGYPFTDDATVDDKAEWKVVFTKTGSTLNKISLVNQWSYKKTSGSESDTSKYVLKTGEEVVLPNDFATFKFVGLQTKPTVEAQVGAVDGIEGGGIKYVDLRGNTISVPFYKQFDIDFNNPTEITVAGKDFTFWIDSPGALKDLNVAYIEGKHSDATSHATWTAFDLNYNEMSTVGVHLDLGAETKNGTTVNTDYNFIADSSDGVAALVLSGNQTFNIQNKAASTSVPALKFLGTKAGSTAGHFKYYIPNNEDFLNVLLNSTRGAYSSSKYFAADVNFVDNASYGTTMYLQTGDTAKVWDYVGIKSSDNNLLGPTYDANAVDWRLGEDVTNALTAAMTQDGSTVDSDSSVFTIVVPEETRNAEVYLGGTETSTTTTGGTTYTGVKAGETKGNVTVTNITGATAGKQIVPVGNIVKLDTDLANGKSIIVGGFMVNQAAKNLTVDGQTLEQRLVASGDYVAAVLNDGKVVVAGYTANDTAVAARALIAAMDAFQ
jgi:hypothetical protein